MYTGIDGTLDPLAMNIQLRKARPKDIGPITAVKRLAWPDEDCDPARVKTALAAPRHQTHVIEVEGELVGFVDGFLTYGENSATRWEVDLLAVHPEYHGRGLGSRLIAANTQAGAAAEADLIRSLIHIDNHASEGAFARCGYEAQPGEQQLMVLQRNAEPMGSLATLDDLILILVDTINYSGIWQESHFTPKGFAAARLALKIYHRDLLGAIIPVEDTAAREAAITAGFDLIGNYRWWAWNGV
jgi:GNAT superfamily N-acetyltransferase